MEEIIIKQVYISLNIKAITYYVMAYFLYYKLKFTPV